MTQHCVSVSVYLSLRSEFLQGWDIPRTNISKQGDGVSASKEGDMDCGKLDCLWGAQIL